MKDEIAIITFKTFIKERLDGNTDSIVDYDLGRLRSDKLYGCPGRKFDPDDTNLMRAIALSLVMYGRTFLGKTQVRGNYVVTP